MESLWETLYFDRRCHVMCIFCFEVKSVLKIIFVHLKSPHENIFLFLLSWCYPSWISSVFAICKKKKKTLPCTTQFRFDAALYKPFELSIEEFGLKTFLQNIFLAREENESFYAKFRASLRLSTSSPHRQPCPKPRTAADTLEYFHFLCSMTA